MQQDINHFSTKTRPHEIQEIHPKGDQSKAVVPYIRQFVRYLLTKAGSYLRDKLIFLGFIGKDNKVEEGKLMEQLQQAQLSDELVPDYSLKCVSNKQGKHIKIEINYDGAEESKINQEINNGQKSSCSSFPPLAFVTQRQRLLAQKEQEEREQQQRKKNMGIIKQVYEWFAAAIDSPEQESPKWVGRVAKQQIRQMQLSALSFKRRDIKSIEKKQLQRMERRTPRIKRKTSQIERKALKRERTRDRRFIRFDAQ